VPQDCPRAAHVLHLKSVLVPLGRVQSRSVSQQGSPPKFVHVASSATQVVHTREKVSPMHVVSGQHGGIPRTHDAPAALHGGGAGGGEGGGGAGGGSWRQSTAVWPTRVPSSWKAGQKASLMPS